MFNNYQSGAQLMFYMFNRGLVRRGIGVYRDLAWVPPMLNTLRIFIDS